jgi:hypothetical protein
MLQLCLKVVTTPPNIHPCPLNFNINIVTSNAQADFADMAMSTTGLNVLECNQELLLVTSASKNVKVCGALQMKSKVHVKLV